jgi:hypothetical protein
VARRGGFRIFSARLEVELEPALKACCQAVRDWPLMQEWTGGALAEDDEIGELEVEF